MIALNAIHAEITWTLSDYGTLTISGTDMPNYENTNKTITTPWYPQRIKIKKIVIKNGVTNIGDFAFNGCSNLTSVTIPNSVRSIGSNTFSYCSNLASITIQNSVTSIGNNAFSYCLSLASITIPNSATSIRDHTFSGCLRLTSITIPNSVTSIGDYTFFGCSGLTSITIPNSVTSIGSGAFDGCSGLTSISIPNSVTSIDNYTFLNCLDLTSIIIPSSVTNIGISAFQNCSGLTSITIPSSVTSIGNSAFMGCENLTSITIPNSLTYIGTEVFNSTKWYEKQSDGLVYIGYFLYEYKGSMPTNTNINIKEGTRGIASSAFSGCSGLSTITIPESMKYIGESAFKDCSSLTSIKIPNSVTNIGSYAFSGCSSLTSISIPESVNSIKFAVFSGCSSLNSIDIPNSVTHIGSSAFEDCSYLTSIVIPESVTSIGNNAFKNCSSLSFVCIPNSMTRIGEMAFYDCKSLSKVICYAVTPPSLKSYAFYGAQCLSGTLYVPSSGVSTYQTTDGWNEWKNIQALIEPTSISFANENENIFIGMTKKLEATITPEKSTNKSITWTSSNTAVATVSSKGIITAKSVGTTVITAKTYNGKSAKCTITVKQPVTAIALSDAATTLWVGETKTLTATATPTDASNTAVNWYSSDNNVATVSSKGVITAKGKGTCTITCTAADGYGTKSTCSVTVKQPVTTIALSDATTSLWVGETKTMTATTTPMTANNTNVSWSSSDNSVATISSKGIITAKGKGTCTITCTAADGYGTKSTCEVTVKQPVTKIALSETTTSLWVGKTKTLTATATPTTANNTTVNWSSSNNSVATVSSKGVITAKGKGTCTITCTAADGYGTKSTCKVTVKQQVTSIDLGYETLTMKCGTEKVLTPTINPSNADVKTLTWKSTDKSVATITSEGVLSAVSPGTATITCTSTDDFKKSSSITVIVEPLDITITDKNPTIKEGTYREGGISYTRTLTKNKYTTFCMPYDVNLSDYTDYFSKVYVPMGTAFVKSGGKLTIMFKSVSLTETIRAGQPFIVLASKSGTVAIKNGSKVTITSLYEPQPTKLEVYNYGGNLLARNTDIDVKIIGNYFFVTDLDDVNNFTFSVNGQMVGATTVSPYRFYITKNDDRSNAKITDMLLSLDGEEVTGIENIINEQNGDDKFYNLNGQRINRTNAQKGVYIINGKKYAK